MSAQPFIIPGAPQELLDIINARRATIPPGMTMTATTTEAGTDQSTEDDGDKGKADDGQKQPDTKTSTEETPEAKIARLERELAASRGEAAKGRVTAKEKAAQDREAEVTQKILTALGLNKDGEKVVNSDELLAKLAERETENKSLRMREAVRDAATDSAEAARLLKFTDFLDAIKDLESGDTEKIKSAIKATLDANPWLKSTPGAAGKSGTDMSGGTGEGAKSKATTLEQAIAAKYA